MSRLFTVASDNSLIDQIMAARERLVIVAPGISKEVASALASRIHADGGPPVLAVILDVDPEVCRLGYGDIEALDLLQPALAARNLRLQTQPGVRIGLVVVDQEILVYTPTPRLIEAGSTSEQKPNAIRITGQGATDLALACGAGSSHEYMVHQEVGLDFVSDNTVQRTKTELKEAPPRQFDLARRERVFNYKLEFVEFSLEHYKLNTRTVQLPADILGLANLEQHFRNTLRIFDAGTPFTFRITDPTDPKKTITLTEGVLSDEANKLRSKYFIPLGSSSYGNLILKRNKPGFEADIKRLEFLVAAYAEKARAAMGEQIIRTRKKLVDALFPRIKVDPPREWLLRSVDGQLSDEEIRVRVENEVDRAFVNVDDSYNPTVTCLFKGVNYETITGDTHFRKAIERYFGYEEAQKLFDEHDSAVAQQPRLPL